MELGLRHRRLPGYGHRAAPGDCEESLPQSSGDGGLVRSSHPVLRRRLHHRSPESEPAVPKEYFVRYLRRGTHGVSARRRPEENEERRSRIHGQGASGELSIIALGTENRKLETGLKNSSR